MKYDELINVAKEYANKNYLNKKKLTEDEELQLLSCGYSVLFLSTCANKTTSELSHAHEFIAQCFDKIGDRKYSEKHRKMVSGYSKLK